jgi:hypothetical protein
MRNEHAAPVIAVVTALIFLDTSTAKQRSPMLGAQIVSILRRQLVAIGRSHRHLFGPLAPIHAVTQTLRGSDHSCASSAIDNGRSFAPAV